MNLPFFFYFFIFTISLLLLLINRRRQINLPPGPKRLPLIGNLHQLDGSLRKSLPILSIKHGPIMFLQLGSIPTLVISSADLAKEFFKTHDLAFADRPVLYAAKKISHNCSSISFAPYGEYWREIKKIAILELLSMKRVSSFEAIRRAKVTQMISNIARSSSSPINLTDIIRSLANNVMSMVLFGTKGEKGNFRIHDILDDTQALLNEVNLADIFPWMSWLNKFNGVDKRLDKNMKELDEFYNKLIADHLDPNKPKTNQDNLLDTMLRNQSLNNKQIKAILTGLCIAGKETTSGTIVWIMAELIKNPSSMKKAQNEVRKQENNVSESNYLKSVVKEALRLHPPLPLLIPRETRSNCIIRNYTIPAKTRVFIQAKSISRDPDQFEDPEEFKPERFENEGFDWELQRFEMLPFGAGRRGCPGLNFSTRLIEFVVGSLLYSFDWSLPVGMNLDMEEGDGLSVHKKNPLFLMASAVFYGDELFKRY